MANYYNPYQNYYNNPYNNMQYQQTIQQVQQPVQQDFYINVSSEQEATNYPIAPNTSLIFIDWKNKKIYEKSRGLSPSDRPSMKIRDITDPIENENTPEQEKTTPVTEYAKKDEIKAIYGEIDSIKAQIEKFTAKKGKKDE